MYHIDSDIGYYDSLNMDERMLAMIAYRWGQANPQKKHNYSVSPILLTNYMFL